MADSTPLLSRHNTTESETPVLQRHLWSLDEAIERCIGNFGWTQFLQAVLVSFAWVFDAQQTFISVFTDAEPTWHCTQLGDESCNSVTISNICHLPKDSWAWDWPIHASIISEWNLECAGSIITGLPTSSFFMGCLVGGLVLSTLADSSLGRKNMLFFSCLVMSLAGVLTTFSTNVYTYSALRFISGFGRSTIGTSALVLATETVGKRWRGQVGVIGFFCFTLGFLSLPAIAYINKTSSWRNLYLCTCIPTIFYCILVHLLVHESPRWLFVQGRKQDAVKTLKSMAPAANHDITTLSFSGVSFEQETWNVDLYSAIKTLVERKWAFRRLSAVMMVGFGIGVVYYGMPLGVGNLAFNLYLSVTLNALSEIPASVITMCFIGKLNRKSALLGFCILSGEFGYINGEAGFGARRRFQSSSCSCREEKWWVCVVWGVRVGDRLFWVVCGMSTRDKRWDPL